MKIDFKKLIPHLVALTIFVGISVVYFYPVIQGYKLKQGDIKQHKGMSQELRDHKAEFDEEPLWIGNMFAGMPAYQVSTVRYSGNILSPIQTILELGFSYPIGLLILYMIGFYILLLSLKIDPWVSIIGSVAFALSSYFIVIMEAGHTSKGFALACMAPVLGGIISILRGRIWLGLLITSIFMGLELYANHLQITYYLIIPILVVGIVEMIGQIKSGNTKQFLSRALLVFAAVLVGVLPNLGNILTTYEYSKASTRSPSELTINPDGSSNKNNVSTGLDKDYITRWSYGIEETFTLLIPNAKGGKTGAILANEEEVDRLRRKDPQFFNFMVNQYQKNQFVVNTYWGNQPFTSGPVYAGSVICLLAFLALFFIKDRLIIGLALATLITIMLSWGKNFMGLTDFFIDYIPLYNKFRAVSMILVIAELILPLMAMLFLYKLIKDKDEIAKQKKKFFIVLGVFVGILFVFWLSPDTFFTFLSDSEKNHLNTQIQQNSQQAQQLYAGFDSIVDYRVEVFRNSILSILKFILIASALMILFVLNKINTRILILGIGIITIADLWIVDKRYLNNEEKPGATSKSADRYKHYQNTLLTKIPYQSSPVDQAILKRELSKHPEIVQAINEEVNQLKQSNPRPSALEIEQIQYTELMRGTHYRVLNTTKKLDEDAETAFFHKTLGGYHGAKMKKYQELIDFELGLEYMQLRQAFQRGGEQLVNQVLPQMNVTNMLNAKYVIGATPVEGGNRLAFIQNKHVLGNAWFVEHIKTVSSADEEILALKELDPSKTAVVRNEDASKLKSNYTNSNTNYITLESYLPNKMVYSYQVESTQFAVFSEIYYKKGWNAYVNGELIPHIKVNYILRGMEIPKGQGEIVFKFEPKSYQLGEYASMGGSFIIFILLGFVVYKQIKDNKAV